MVLDMLVLKGKELGQDEAKTFSLSRIDRTLGHSILNFSTCKLSRDLSSHAGFRNWSEMWQSLYIEF